VTEQTTNVSLSSWMITEGDATATDAVLRSSEISFQDAKKGTICGKKNCIFRCKVGLLDVIKRKNA
jgi:hypothetical protein